MSLIVLVLVSGSKDTQRLRRSRKACRDLCTRSTGGSAMSHPLGADSQLDAEARFRPASERSLRLEQRSIRMNEIHDEERGRRHPPKRIVLTGGPGGGKTAVLEIVRRHLHQHVAVLPEAATIVFGGGFPRRPTHAARRAAQRAIFHVQAELESLAVEEGYASVVLCDRGTVDGVAYWPDDPEEFWRALGTTHEAELARYAAVIHLRTPPAGGGYNHDNRLRSESAQEAANIDERIAAAWAGHPRRFFIDNEREFMAKAVRALALIEAEVANAEDRCAAAGDPRERRAAHEST